MDDSCKSKRKSKKNRSKVQYFTVYLEDVMSQVNDSLEKSIDDINRNINDYIDEDFQKRIDIYFNELNSYLSNYSENIAQAQEDKKRKTEEKNRLIYELNYLMSESKQKINSTMTYVERIKRLMEDK